MRKVPISYVELPSQDVATSKLFYGSLFGWSFQDFGPTYVAFSDAGMAGGFQGESTERTNAPLVVLETDDIEGLQDRLQRAGGTITAPIFSFPGGRRFHFTDPSGNELAVMQKA
jgi:uncharacterized protein